MKAVSAAITEACKEKTERDRRRGIKNRPVRAMVAGIPNVGKSTFINTFAGKACAKTGNKPGVTKGKQWIRLNKSVELLDTPGILWPKFEDQEVGMRLCLYRFDQGRYSEHRRTCPGSDRISAQEFYPAAIRERYNVEEELKPLDILAVAKARGCLKRAKSLIMRKHPAFCWKNFVPENWEK